ncbi:MAG: DUF5330 domain-containing protein [Rhodobacteraceae bacterium]|nr:DUF5330 domain-containing protein [Paracoccaceae bacterium]
MFFLMRTAFWLTLVLVLISFGSEEKAEATVDPIKAFFAAQATVSDLGGFCSRNPQVCETGGEALSAIGARARDGARMVYEFIDSKSDTIDETKVAAKEEFSELTTGSTAKLGTLTAPDLSQPWTGIETTGVQAQSEIGPVPRPNPRAI